MKKRLILAFIIMFAATVAQAQQIRGFLSAGGTLSQIEGDELRGFDNIGWSAGVGAITNIDQYGNWLFATEIIYTRRGVFNNTSNESNFKYNIYLPLDYIDIPLTFFYRDPIGKMMFGVGPVYGRLVQQPHEVLYYKNTFLPDTTDMAFLKNDFAIAAECRFKVWKWLELSVRWQYSVLPVKKDWTFYERTNAYKTKSWDNNCYNNSITFRVICQFGNEPAYKQRRHK